MCQQTGTILAAGLTGGIAVDDVEAVEHQLGPLLHRDAVVQSFFNILGFRVAVDDGTVGQRVAHHRLQFEVAEHSRLAEISLVQLHPKADFNAVGAVERKFTAERPRHSAGGAVAGIASGLPAVAPRLHLQVSGIADSLGGEREPVAGYRKLVRARLLRQLKAEDLPQLPPGEVDALRAEVARLRTVNLRLAERITAVQREQAQRARRETPGRGGSAEDSPGGRRYRVQSGDTLGRIAVKFYGSAAKSEGIRRANRLPEGAVLRIGQELILPAE